MPHNLETLCLCYADQTCSEVPISSSNRDTVRKGGETAFSFPRSSLPRCRVVITQREVLIRLGILSDTNAVNPVWKASGIPSRLWRFWGKTPACSGVCQLGVKRNTELVNKGRPLRSTISERWGTLWSGVGALIYYLARISQKLDANEKKNRSESVQNLNM